MDHLALLGDLDLRIKCSGRLGADRLVRWSTAPTHGPTAPVENAQAPPVPGDDRRDRFMRAVERPCGAEVADLLVAIGVTEHDFLDPGATVELTAVDRVGEKGVHRGRRSLQRIEPLEQWHDIEITARWIAVELVKTGQPRQEQGLEDILGCLRHAHDQGLGRSRSQALRLRHCRQRRQQVAGVR